jgi:AraC-like DNA-binding protein
MVKYFFLIAAFNAFFFSVLLIQKKSKALHDRILVYWLLYLGIYIGIYSLTSRQLFTGFPLLSASFISLLMLHGPFLYLYIHSLINNEHKFNVNYFLHFAPFILFNFYLIVVSFLPETSGNIRLDHVESEIGAPWLFNLFLIVTALSGPVYFILSINLFKKLDINIFNNFSTIENINLDWLRKLVYTFAVVWTVLMAIATIHHVFHLFSWIFCADGLSLSISGFIILIGYFGLKQKEIFSGYDKNQFITEGSATKYEGSGLKESDALQYAERLKNFMDTERPYLNPDLNLPQLAKDLDIPSHQLSQVINKNIGLNFFDFINSYRVEEIKAKISNPEYNKLSMLGIAFESGFNSKSAFNRVFKNLSGETPTQYKKRVTT